MKLMELIMKLDTMETNADLNMEITGIHNDSRAVKPGYLFVAISGALHDGHTYIQKALQNGALAVVSEQPLSNSVPFIVVPDTKVALSKLDAAFMGYPAESLCMVGVTGTNGKTTTTHLIHGLLSAKKNKTGLIGTNHILIGNEERVAERTTPDAVALHSLLRDMVDSGCSHCAMEVSSHALEQCRVAGIDYDVAVFTNLSQDHLDYHITMTDYFNAKCKLFTQCKKGLVNNDDPYGRELNKLHGNTLGTYGILNDAELKAEGIELHPDGVSFTAVWKEKERVKLSWRTPGSFTVYNMLAVVRCVLELGFTLEETAEYFPSLPPVCGRMEVLDTKADYTVIIDYAHTPEALENVLHASREAVKNRLITVFGCGGDRDISKRAHMGAIASALSDICVITSDNPRSEDPNKIIEDIIAGTGKGKPLYPITDRREAIYKALEIAQTGDTVLICGKGHEMYQEIREVRYPMDEREIVASYWRIQDDV